MPDPSQYGILDHARNFFNRFTEGVNIENLAKAASDPRKTLADMIESGKDINKQGQAEVSNNQPILGNIRKALSYVPLAGPPISNSIDEFRSGDYGNALGDLAPLALAAYNPETFTKTIEKGSPNLRGSLVKAMFNQRNSPTELNALRESQTPVSVGQATGNPTAQFIEKLAGGRKAQRLNDTQAAAMQNFGNQNTISDFPKTIQDLSDKLQGKVKQEKAGIGQKYTNFEQDFENTPTQHNEIDPSSQQPSPSGLVGPNGQPIVSPPILRSVNKPIELHNSVQTAKELAQSLNEEFPNPNIVTGPTRRLLDTVNHVADTPSSLDVSGNETGIPVRGYDQVKALKDALNDSIDHNTGNPISSKSMGINKKLATNLKADISNSLSTYDQQTGGDLSGKYTGASSAYKEFANKFNPDAAQKLIEGGKDPDSAYRSVVQPIFSDAKFAKQATNVLGKVQTAKLALDNLTNAGYNPTTESFDPTSILNELDKNRESYKELMTSNRLSNYERTVRSFAVMEPISETGMLGHGAGRSLKGIALSIPGVIAGALLGHPTAGGIASSAGGYLLLKSFTNKIMLDPAVSRLLYDSSKTPVTSTQYVPLQKRLFKALAGVDATVVNGTKQTPVTISPNGNVVSNNHDGKASITFDSPEDTPQAKASISFDPPDQQP